MPDLKDIMTRFAAGERGTLFDEVVTDINQNTMAIMKAIRDIPAEPQLLIALMRCAFTLIKLKGGDHLIPILTQIATVLSDKDVPAVKKIVGISNQDPDDSLSTGKIH